MKILYKTVTVGQRKRTTKYYAAYDGKKVCFAPKRDAAKFTPEQAAQTLKHLELLGFTGFRIMDELERADAALA